MTEPALRYDEARLTESLAALSPTARAAFAAACAERLLPVYRWVHHRTGRGDPAALERALAQVWSNLPEPDPAVLQGHRELAEGLVPDEDDSWVYESAYAGNAAAAVAYAVGALATGSTKEAVAAACQVYEALDYRVTNRGDVDLNAPGIERMVAADPLIQRELQRQRHDLDALRQLPAAATSPAEVTNTVVAELRQRARAAGHSLLDFPLA